MGVEFDFSEFDDVLADLDKAPGRAVPKLTAATRAASGKIREAMVKDATGIGHAPHFPRSITDEVKFGVGRISAEIGPDKSRKQGALGNILYFGGSKSGPVLDINGPLDQETPAYVKAIEEILGDVL
jgi:hypothetical protein